jgi:Putative auto-transporter adhesin, head GIN domain
MKKISISILAALLISVGGCNWHGIRGNHVITTEQRSIGAFSNLEADGAFQIEWTSGAPALSVTTDQNLLHYIRSEVSGDKLRLHSTEHLWPTHGIKVIVSSPSLNGAQFRGAVRFAALQISGANFFLESQGASKITLAGKVGELTAGMTGASKLMAESLQTDRAELSLTGASKAEVNVTDTLKVSITGAGKVVYSGNPRRVERDVTGAGTIRAKE